MPAEWQNSRSAAAAELLKHLLQGEGGCSRVTGLSPAGRYGRILLERGGDYRKTHSERTFFEVSAAVHAAHTAYVTALITSDCG